MTTVINLCPLYCALPSVYYNNTINELTGNENRQLSDKIMSLHNVNVSFGLEINRPEFAAKLQKKKVN
jgi:hypothetical protein